MQKGEGGNDNFWGKQNCDLYYTFYYYERGHLNIEKENLEDPLVMKSTV